MLKELLIEKTPKYTELLPISQKRINYRPFVVREEKNLIIAKETSSFDNLMMTIREVVNSCAEGLPNDDCKSLPFCDLEYLFIKIREKSLGENVECVVTCPITNEKINTSIDISKLKVTNKKINTKLKLDTNIAVTMQLPTLETYLSLNNFNVKEEEENVFKLLALCIKEVESGEEKFYTKDVPHTEVIEFIEQLSAKQFKILLNFLKEIPTIEQNIEYTTSDGVKRNIVLKGFTDFLELFLVMRI